MDILTAAGLVFILSMGVILYVVVGQLLKRLSDLENDVSSQRRQIHDLKDRLNVVITENTLLRHMLGYPLHGPIPGGDVSIRADSMADSVTGDKTTGSNQKTDTGNFININIDREKGD